MCGRSNFLVGEKKVFGRLLVTVGHVLPAPVEAHLACAPSTRPLLLRAFGVASRPCPGLAGRFGTRLGARDLLFRGLYRPMSLSSLPSDPRTAGGEAGMLPKLPVS